MVSTDMVSTDMVSTDMVGTDMVGTDIAPTGRARRRRPSAGATVAVRDSVLIISAMAPVPVDNGKRMILRGLLDYFVERLGAENVHYALLGDPGEERPDFPGIAHRLERPNSLAQLAALARLTTDRSYTAQEAMLGSPGVRKQIQALVSWLRPTIEVYDTIRLGQHAPVNSHARRRVLYLDDLFSMRYERIIDFSASGGMAIDPLGEFVTNIPPVLRGMARKPAFYRRILRMEGKRIRRRENEIVKDFDVTLLVNPHEVESLRARTGSRSVRMINGLLPAVPVTIRRPVDPPEFVFLGRLNVPHNDAAISMFLQEEMSELERRIPGVVVRLIGRGASDALRELAARHPDSVRIEGYVEDLEPVFARATACLAPLRFGTGIKIKVLDALARGLPVVGTRVALDGIPAAADGADGFVVEDDVAKWPELLVGLSERKRNAELSKAAFAFFERTYRRDVVMAQYDDIFRLTNGERETAAPVTSASNFRAARAAR